MQDITLFFIIHTLSKLLAYLLEHDDHQTDSVKSTYHETPTLDGALGMYWCMVILLILAGLECSTYWIPSFNYGHALTRQYIWLWPSLI